MLTVILISIHQNNFTIKYITLSLGEKLGIFIEFKNEILQT